MSDYLTCPFFADQEQSDSEEATSPRGSARGGGRAASAEGEAALREAFNVDALSHGASIEGFIGRWIPADLDRAVSEVRAILNSFSEVD